MGISEMFFKGGPVMYALLACSLAAAAIAAERLSVYRRAASKENELGSGLISLLQHGETDTLMKSTSAASVIAVSGAQAAKDGLSVQLAVDTSYSGLAMELRARLNYLSMIVTLAPLLGLLGTISGMISSFNVFSLAADQPLAITGGIGEALIATAFGLCVAILALVLHTVLAQKLDRLLAEMDRAAAITGSVLDERNGGGHHAS